MQTLFIMRHGKSSWKDPELADTERPLKKRGRKDSKTIGKFLEEKDLIPQAILCSTALRARQTAEAMMDEMDFEGQVDYHDTLYMAEPDAIIRLLQNVADAERVMVIGHNPGLETLVQLLTDQIVSLPTAALAQIKLPLNSWQELGLQTHGELANLWLPKELAD